MKLRTLNIAHLLLLACFWICPLCIEDIFAKEFVVVIDPGHGGHDPGALGKISKEKDINLKVSLRLGNLIKSNCPDVKVIYTRDKDVFVRLDRRAEIANNAKADLFISVHTNALGNNKTAKGASTWTLGLAKSEANLDVAKRENGVILYEDDYQSRYAGFDPRSSESYIIFEFMQDQYMSQSVHFASVIQQHFKSTCKRVDRGVHQAGFLVLKASAMPSVLIELGFISTPEEERYLNSEQGLNELARGIYLAFVQYKNEQQGRLATSGVGTGQMPQTPPTASPSEAKKTVAPEKVIEKKSSPTVSDTPKVTAASGGDRIVFKVQILASQKALPKNSREFKGLKDVSEYREKGLYKYTYGASENYNEIVRLRKEISTKFAGAFIVAFKNGEKMDVNAAIAEYKKRK